MQQSNKQKHSDFDPKRHHSKLDRSGSILAGESRRSSDGMSSYYDSHSLKIATINEPFN